MSNTTNTGSSSGTNTTSSNTSSGAQINNNNNNLPTVKQGENFYEQSKHYINYIVNVVNGGGPKMLLVDDEVARFLNVTFTHSQLLIHEVFVVDSIQKADRPPMKHFHCIIFVRPTHENFQAVTAELELANFKDYYLFFTNMFAVDSMQFLVRSDVAGKVKHCEEVYLDMFPVTDETCCVPLFIPGNASISKFQQEEFIMINNEENNNNNPAKKSSKDDEQQPPARLPREMIDSTKITRNPMTISQWENADFVRATEGIVAMALASSRRPQIRYRSSSRVCSRLASELGSRARNLQHRFFDLPSKDSVILILDRFDDPITPLITSWTYQAICHEILGIHSGIVETPVQIKKKKIASPQSQSQTTNQPQSANPGSKATTPQSQLQQQQPKEEFEIETRYEQHVLSIETDAFYKAHRDVGWPELCVATKDLVDAFLEINNVDLRTKSLAEIGAIGEKLPEMRQQNTTAMRHSTIVSEIGKRIKSRSLPAISVLEQDLVCGVVPTLSDFTSYSKRFLDAMGNPSYSHHDALRLAILFELRHEERRDTAMSGAIRSLLRQRGIDPNILDAVMALGGQNRNHQRATDLFPQDAKNKDAGQKVVSVFKSFAKVLKEFNEDEETVSKVWVKHRPQLQTVLDSCARGSLSTEAYPFYRSAEDNSSSASSTDSTSKPKEILVFMVGGLTYSEALIAKRINEATRNASYTAGGGGGLMSMPSGRTGTNNSSKSTNNKTTPSATTNRKSSNNDAAASATDDDDAEKEDDPSVVPESLIGCRIFLGSTAMLTSETFLRGMVRR